MNELTGLEGIDGMEDLMGVDDISGLDAVQKKAVKAKITKVAKVAATRGYPELTKEQNLLLKKSKNMSQDFQQKVRSGNVQFVDAVRYIRKKTTGNITEMFDDGDDKVIGITNFSKQKLPQNVNMMVSRLQLEVAPGDATDVKEADFDTVVNAANILKNAEVEIELDERTILTIPVADFCEPKTLNSLPNGFNLKAPKLITDQNKVQARIKMPLGKSLDTQVYINLSFVGQEIRTK